MSQFKIRPPQAEKVAAIRALADRTPYISEREVALAKAGRLMHRYDLTEADLIELEIDPLIRVLFGISV